MAAAAAEKKRGGKSKSTEEPPLQLRRSKRQRTYRELEGPITRIPADILGLVFDWVDPAAKLVLPAVCKLWATVHYNRLHPSITSSTQYETTDEDSDDVDGYLSGLLGDKGLNDTLIQRCRAERIRKVNLAYCTKITDTGIERMVKACPHIEELNLSWCMSLTDSSLQHIAAHCTRLRSLAIYGIPIRTTQNIGLFFEVVNFELWREQRGWNAYTAEGGHQVGITREGLASLVEALPALRELHMYRVEHHKVSVAGLLNRQFERAASVPTLPTATYMKHQVDITGRMRVVLLDWLAECGPVFGFQSSTVYLAGQLVDRYMGKVRTLHRRRYQLLGTAALLLASKYMESHPMSVRDGIWITADSFTAQDFAEMERKVLKVLGNVVGEYTPMTFLMDWCDGVSAVAENPEAHAPNNGAVPANGNPGNAAAAVAAANGGGGAASKEVAGTPAIKIKASPKAYRRACYLVEMSTTCNILVGVPAAMVAAASLFLVGAVHDVSAAVLAARKDPRRPAAFGPAAFQTPNAYVLDDEEEELGAAEDPGAANVAAPPDAVGAAEAAAAPEPAGLVDDDDQEEEDADTSRLSSWVPDLLALRHCTDTAALMKCTLQLAQMAVGSPTCWSQVVRKRYMASSHWSSRFEQLEDKILVSAGLARVHDIISLHNRRSRKGVVPEESQTIRDQTNDVFFSNRAAGSVAAL